MFLCRVGYGKVGRRAGQPRSASSIFPSFQSLRLVLTVSVSLPNGFYCLSCHSCSIIVYSEPPSLEVEHDCNLAGASVKRVLDELGHRLSQRGDDGRRTQCRDHRRRECCDPACRPVGAKNVVHRPLMAVWARTGREGVTSRPAQVEMSPSLSSSSLNDILHSLSTDKTWVRTSIQPL